MTSNSLSQKQAMAMAKRSLEAATADATKKNPGYRAVSAMPRIEDGHPFAAVSLLKGDDDWKTVSVPLDSAR
jgi:acyl-homoserine lactone acylase PvdQ